MSKTEEFIEKLVNENKYGYIYKIQFPNGKHYIGQTTTSLKQRTKEHRRCAKNGDTKCLYNALRKYDMVDTFELIEIYASDTLEELREKEIRYIKEYNSYYMNKQGYNMTYGGEGINGYVFTEDDNIKNSERRKKYYEKYPEKKKEHSERMKKIFENPDAIEKNREAQIKYFQTPGAREKCSEAQKKRFENPETIIKMSESRKKYFQTPGAREKCSEAQKKRFENPEEKQRMSEIKKQHFKNDPDARRKSSKGQHDPFDVFTNEGTYIKTFNYQFEAREYLQKEYNITTFIKISEVLTGTRNSSAGFVFKYKIE